MRWGVTLHHHDSLIMIYIIKTFFSCTIFPFVIHILPIFPPHIPSIHLPHTEINRHGLGHCNNSGFIGHICTHGRFQTTTKHFQCRNHNHMCTDVSWHFSYCRKAFSTTKSLTCSTFHLFSSTNSFFFAWQAIREMQKYSICE